MRKTLTSSVLAFAIAFTGISSAPARASNDEFGRAVAGIIVLTIIGNAIRDVKMGKTSKDKQMGKTSKDKQKKAKVSKSKNQKIGSSIAGGYRHIRPGRPLPKQCFFVMRSKDGPRGVYGQKCVDQLSPRPTRIPRTCVDTVPVRYGRDAKVYDAQCLRRYGYQIEAHRH